MHCNQCPLISIIIPVYQVEKYLDKCIASVVNQTYSNLEIILVDDGSPDNCPAICDAWKERDPRINVIHQENGGLSHARNEGLKLAVGEFIGFVDSDDWIEPNMYETLLSIMMDAGIDIAVCNYQNESEDLMIINKKITLPITKIYSVEEALKLLLSGKSFIRSYVWNKLFKKRILKNLLFTEDKLYEDVVWTPQVIGLTNSIIIIDLPLYHYLGRPDSLSRNVHNLYQRLMDASEMLEQRIQYIHEQYPSLENLAIAKYQIYCCNNYVDIMIKKKQSDVSAILGHILHDNFSKWIWSKNLTLGIYKDGIKCFIFRFFPRFLPMISSIYNKLKNINYKIEMVIYCYLY